VDGPSSKLAARFRKALESEASRKAREAEEARVSLEEARRARELLLAQLAETGAQIGLKVERSDAGVTLRHGARYVHFGRDGDGDRVRVAHAASSAAPPADGAPPEEGTIVRQPELGNRWILVRRRPRETRQPLFDQGFEDLLVRVLGLPAPDAE
jgi:hypothetical protein